MDETDDKATSWVAFFPVVLLMASMLYVLSIGPVALLFEKAKLSPEATEAAHDFYWPVLWLHANTPLAKPLELYVAAWGVR